MIQMKTNKRRITKVGDVFCVAIDDKYKKYLQYIASDLTQLNSDVVRVFNELYPINDVVNPSEVVNGTVDFYAHCSTSLGIKKGLWENRAFPDSLVLVAPNLFNTKNTCYVYVIKWHDATHYLLDEIREKHLYDRRVITIEDFQNRVYEYR